MLVCIVLMLRCLRFLFRTICTSIVVCCVLVVIVCDCVYVLYIFLTVWRQGGASKWNPPGHTAKPAQHGTDK